MNIFAGKIKKPFSDYLGILSSIICLIHCLITPAILSIQMIYYTNSTSYEIFEYVFLLLSFIAVLFSSRKYSSFVGKSIMWITFLIFAVSIIFHNIFTPIISYLATFGLILLHFLNIYPKK